MIKTYYMLTKPGIIMGNLITTMGGFALASKGQMDYGLLLLTLLGLSLVIASAGVFNNYLDRESDKRMKRTQGRPLVRQMITETRALLFALVLGLVGFAVLGAYTNLLTVGITLAGFFIYVVLYIIWKYRSIHGTLIGSVSGAIPPLVGYCAVSGQLDMGAFILFLILVFWQMPHFFAIAVYHFDDYLAAAIPVLPVKRGLFVTKVHMLLYIIGFIMATLMLTWFNYTGYTYFIIAVIMGLAWFGLGLTGLIRENHQFWARDMFRLSLVIITTLCLMISLDTL